MADNLAPGDRNDDRDVFVYDVETRSVALVSRTSSGVAANAASGNPAIAADRRRIAFQSLASNLGSASACGPVVPDRNLLPDVYLLDRTMGCITRVSGTAEHEWWSASVAPAIDAAGVVVTFSSTQPVSDEEVTTGFDLFLFERPR